MFPVRRAAIVITHICAWGRIEPFRASVHSVRISRTQHAHSTSITSHPFNCPASNSTVNVECQPTIQGAAPSIRTLTSTVRTFNNAKHTCKQHPHVSPRLRRLQSCAVASSQAWHGSQYPPAHCGAHCRHFTRQVCLGKSNQTRVFSTSDAQGRTPSDGDSLASLKRLVTQVSEQLDGVRAVMDVATMRAQLALLQHDASADNLWDDAAAAQKLLSKINSVKTELDDLQRNEKAVEDGEFVVELLESEEGSAEASASLLAEAFSGLRGVLTWLDEWEVQRLLSGRFDEHSARLSIQAGAGGTDAMDWAEMLERMYVRWSNSKDFKVTVVDRKAGEEAGIQSVEVEIAGMYAYGYLHGEKGTHRLVRNSPFNSKGLRQTSFAGVEVMPVLEEELELDIPPKDLEVQFMRSGGKGGQNVNKVETGVRMTHIPTGLVVKCTEERSQEMNRARALERLKAKLLVVLEEQRAQEVVQIRGDMVKAEWGQQIRNYVFCPYKLVKDTRTGEQTSDVTSVMDGNLDDFIKSYLKWKAKQSSDSAAEVASVGRPASQG